ncbi:MAG: DUF3644 domain-containing protein [Zoogloea sp.]|nr:MAG: DUF3644 domain-containing protein [Zoogloea sp.]
MPPVKPRSKNLLCKAVEALIAAIEIYNKPVFGYREETFAILAVNAWELLAKARLLQLAGNKMSAILEYAPRIKANGDKTEKAYRRRNKAGNAITVGLFKALDRLGADYGAAVDAPIRQNLEAIAEIRDNAVHFANKDLAFAKSFHEISSATVANFVQAARIWFGDDLSDRRMFLMPLAFISGVSTVPGLSMNGEERHLARYLEDLKSADTGHDGNFAVALTVEISMKRTKDGSGSPFSVTRDPSAVMVRLEEADIRETYPWEYSTLRVRLRNRYENFKENSAYHLIRKELEKDSRFCRRRLLDPGKPDGTKKNFYSPNILREFDAHYTRRKPSSSPE